MKGNLNSGGFTLVELIVVIAVLAILAGVAVPAYSGYVNKAHEAMINLQLSQLERAAQVAAMAEETQLLKITVTSEGAATAYCAAAYAADGLTVSAYRVIPLTDFHSGRIENMARHPDFYGGCTWTAGRGYWEEGVENLPLAQP